MRIGTNEVHRVNTDIIVTEEDVAGITFLHTQGVGAQGVGRGRGELEIKLENLKKRVVPKTLTEV